MSQQAGSEPLRITAVGGGAAGVESLLAVLAGLREAVPGRPIEAEVASASAGLLPGLAASAASRMREVLRERGVAVRLGHRFDASALPSRDLVLWATGAEAHGWPRASGLAVNHEGFIRVDEHLRSLSHAQVFAAGDCIAWPERGLPKAGVFAVKMGPALSRNLRAVLGSGERLEPYRAAAALPLAALDGRPPRHRDLGPLVDRRRLGLALEGPHRPQVGGPLRHAAGGAAAAKEAAGPLRPIRFQAASASAAPIHHPIDTKLIMKLARRIALLALASLATLAAHAAEPPLKFGVGLFQPDKEKNDATYRPLAAYLAKKLGRPVELRTVDTWEGLAKSLANGETDMALLGPWGYVLANNEAGAQVVSTIEYDGKPEYYAIMVTSPDSGIKSVADLKGKTFAFGDKGSTSGYLIPLHFFQTQGIVPETYFSKVLYTKHQAIETQVTQGQLDAGADYNRNRDAMIEQGLIKAERSKIIWQSAPLPNDAFAVSKPLAQDKAFVAKLQDALTGIGAALKGEPKLLPNHYTGFVVKDNSFYKPIRDAGLATGKLQPKE